MKYVVVVVGGLVMACGSEGMEKPGPGRVANVAVSGEPAEAIVGVPLPPIVVTLQDADGRTVTEASEVVVLELAGPAGPIALGGTTTAMSLQGAAVFEDLEIAGPVDDVQLVARVATLEGTSGMFDVVFGPPSMASAWTFTMLMAPADGVTAIEGEVTIVNAGGVPIPDLPVTVQMPGPGNDPYPHQGKTDANGRFTSALSSAIAGTKSVIALAGGTQVTGSITFTQALCTPLLPRPPSERLADTALEIVAVDLDADGRIDLATAESSAISVLRGIGDGRFKPPVRYPSGALTMSIATGDFDGDGDQDLVTANRDTDTVRVFLNQGDATLVAGVSIPLVRAQRVATADLDANGTVDVLARDDANVLVYLGIGNGQFQSGVPYSLALNNLSVSAGPLQLVDLNGDTKLDLLTSSGTSPSTLQFFAGNGNGTFQPVSTMTGTGGRAAIADFDEDGKLDLAYAGYFKKGNGDGTFGADITVFFANISQVAAHDVNADGHVDLVGAGSELVVAFGNGDGTFQLAPHRWALPSNSMDLRLADVNGDGIHDAITPQFSGNSGPNLITTTLGTSGTFVAPWLTNTVAPQRARFLAGLGDFDGNGTKDFLSRSPLTSETSVQLADAAGLLTPSSPVIQSGDVPRLHDFNSDGKLDVLFANGLTVSWLRGEGDGRLQAAVTSSPGVSASSHRIAVADVNADGNLDLLLPATDNVGVSLGDGAGGFGTATTVSVLNANGAFAADLDGDGDLDLVATSSNGSVNIAANAGNGTFATPVSYPVFGLPNGVAIADFDNDGVRDLVVGDSTRRELHLLTGNVNGTFDAEVRLQVAFYPTEVTAVDVDADDNTDIVGSHGALFQGRGDGTFRSLLYGGGGMTSVADLDGDGRLDLIDHSLDVGLTRSRNVGCL